MRKLKLKNEKIGKPKNCKTKNQKIVQRKTEKLKTKNKKIVKQKIKN